MKTFLQHALHPWSPPMPLFAYSFPAGDNVSEWPCYTPFDFSFLCFWPVTNSIMLVMIKTVNALSACLRAGMAHQSTPSLSRIRCDASFNFHILQHKAQECLCPSYTSWILHPILLALVATPPCSVHFGSSGRVMRNIVVSSYWYRLYYAMLLGCNMAFWHTILASSKSSLLVRLGQRGGR